VRDSTTGDQRYRTKIEVLRDLVRAATRERRKTRIIGVANLNRGSFDRYAEVAVSMGLLESRGQEYIATPIARDWLGAVDGILARGSQVAAALKQLGRLTPGGREADPSRGNDLTQQLLARLAWAELVAPHLSVSGARRNDDATDGGAPSNPRAPRMPIRPIGAGPSRPAVESARRGGR
jgi:predicted transcriptional regulator